MLTLLCQAAGQRFVLDARQVVEVVPRVHLHAISGAPSWLAGFFAYRGRVTPVLDLAHLVGGSPCPIKWSSRIIIIRHGAEGSSSQERYRLAGLLVEQVAPRQLDSLEDLHPRTSLEDQAAAHSSWGTILLDKEGIYQTLDLGKLLSGERRQALLLASSLEGGGNS